jgi:hypothetical protein
MASPTNLEKVKAILHTEKDAMIQQEISDLEQVACHVTVLYPYLIIQPQPKLIR